jgi:hypothetical protein
MSWKALALLIVDAASIWALVTLFTGALKIVGARLK